MPGKHSTAERAVGYDGYTQLTTCGEEVCARGVFNVECERGVFDLHGVDGVDSHGATEAGGRAFGEAEVAYFSGVDRGGHGGDDGLDGDFAVEAVARGGL